MVFGTLAQNTKKRTIPAQRISNTRNRQTGGKSMQIIKIIVAILLYGYAVGYFIGAFALYEAPNAKPVKPKIKAMMYGQIAVEIIAATLLLKN
jgi:hypothetical protein